MVRHAILSSESLRRRDLPFLALYRGNLSPEALRRKNLLLRLLQRGDPPYRFPIRGDLSFLALQVGIYPLWSYALEISLLGRYALGIYRSERYAVPIYHFECYAMGAFRRELYSVRISFFEALRRENPPVETIHRKDISFRSPIYRARRLELCKLGIYPLDRPSGRIYLF